MITGDKMGQSQSRAATYVIGDGDGEEMLGHGSFKAQHFFPIPNTDYISDSFGL